MRAHDEPVATGHQQRPVRRADAPAADHLRAGAASSGHPLSPAALLHLQRTAGNASVAQLLEDEHTEEEPSPVKDVVGSGGGQPLDATTRAFMEARIGGDFGDVRIHTDAKATESARAVQANAYTVGHDVVFRSDQWSPGTDSGQRMLAHELTHVVQQSAGPVDGTPAPGGIRLSDPSDRFEREADQVADQVMSAAPDVQRQEDEEEELQMSPVHDGTVQREEDEVESEE